MYLILEVKDPIPLFYNQDNVDIVDKNPKGAVEFVQWVLDNGHTMLSDRLETLYQFYENDADNEVKAELDYLLVGADVANDEDEEIIGEFLENISEEMTKYLHYIEILKNLIPVNILMKLPKELLPNK